MISRFGLAAAVVVITAAALYLRVPSLGNRPIHGDEAVHAFKFKDVWEKGVYHYDPHEYHGPTIYYAALPIVELKGRDRFGETRESDFRLAIALFGAVLIPLLWILRDALGRRGVFWSVLFTAFSPALVFYSRYYIQEIPLVFFTLAWLGCWWRWRKSNRLHWLVLSGVSAGLMIATKETALLTFIAAGVAWIFTRSLLNDRTGESGRIGHSSYKIAAVFGTAAVAAAFLFLSGFFSDWGGPFRYLQSYLIWVQRAVSPTESRELAGAGIHNQPWHYYLSMLFWTHRARGPVWTESLILGLALTGFIASFARGIQSRAAGEEGFGSPGFVRFIAVYTLILTVIYAAIPYKTPWSMLTFLHGMILLAGVGAALLVDLIPRLPLKALAAAALLAGCAHLGWLAYRTSFVYPIDGRNPYAYAQPVPDVIELGKRVNELAAVHPLKAKMPVLVFAADTYYWPIPWYLRGLENVGYWTELPANAKGPVIIAAPAFDEELTKRLDPTHLMTGYYGLRPSALMMLWVSLDLWEPYLKSRPRPQE